jgi:hypothetical protein
VHDHLVALVVDARSVAAENHRELFLAQARAAQRPNIVVVERGGAYGDRGPPVRYVGVLQFADREPGQRIRFVERGGVGREHVILL